MLKRTIAQKAEIAALATFLSDWNETISYEALLEAIVEEDYSLYEISVWQPFEDYTGEQLADWIDDQNLFLKGLFESDN
jgi:hypothetical protein